MRVFFLMFCIWPVMLYSSPPPDRYLKRDLNLDRVSKTYLTRYGTAIDSDRVYRLLVASRIFDIEYVSISGKFQTLEDFKLYINKKLAWRVSKYSHWGYYSRKGLYFAVLLKRYFDHGFVGFRSDGLWVISGRLRPEVKSIMAFVQEEHGGVFQVLPSSTHERNFVFKFSRKVGLTGIAFELVVDTKFDGRRVAAIMRRKMPASVLSQVRFKSPEEAGEYLFKKINEERVSRGLNPLSPDLRLSKIAWEHSREMAEKGRVFHSNPEEKGLSSGIFYSHLLENVGASNSIASIHRRFVESPAHLRNLLDEHVMKIGVGIVFATLSGRKHVYATEIFMKPISSLTGKRFSKQRFFSFINSERIKRGELPFIEDRKLFREARTFLKNRGELKNLAQYFSLSSLRLRRIAYNYINTGSIFSAGNNPVFFEEAFTHIAVIPPRNNDPGKKTLIVLASYKPEKRKVGR